MRGYCPTIRCTYCGHLGHSNIFYKKLKSGIRGAPTQLPVVRQSGSKQSSFRQVDTGVIRSTQPNRSQAGSDTVASGNLSRASILTNRWLIMHGSTVV